MRKSSVYRVTSQLVGKLRIESLATELHREVTPSDSGKSHSEWESKTPLISSNTTAGSTKCSTKQLNYYVEVLVKINANYNNFKQ